MEALDRLLLAPGEIAAMLERTSDERCKEQLI